MKIAAFFIFVVFAGIVGAVGAVNSMSTVESIESPLYVPEGGVERNYEIVALPVAGEHLWKTSEAIERDRIERLENMEKKIEMLEMLEMSKRLRQ